jgi:hypothetical protein
MKPNHNNLATSNAIAADAEVVSNSAVKSAARTAAQAGRGGVDGSGAQPSITAPANSIRPLRHGVDSLYVSFTGVVDPELADWLQQCKLKAQSSNEHVISLAGIGIGDHQFTVLPRGRGRFAFVLEDNWFSIQLSNGLSGVLPLAYVQIRSQYLTAVGPDEALATLTSLINGMGKVSGEPKLSRVDLFADFCTDYEMTRFPSRDWVKRCKKRAIYEEADEVTGISFGSENEVSARLYDKTREIIKSGKDYMRPLWAMEGWTESEQVWRMEFQIQREGLPSAMLGPASDALRLSGNLWRYLCDDWLRLAIPSASDDTRSRWPTHPLWEDMSRLWDIDPEAPPLTRVSRARLPSDDQLFRNGFSGLSSFMAREAITDFSHGLGEYLHALEAYHNNPARQFPEGLRTYVSRKTKGKARRYNVRLESHEPE